MNAPFLAAIDPACCPVCGRANQCAMEAQRNAGLPQAGCWCTQVDFNPALLDSLPMAVRGRACICRDCAVAAGKAGEAGWP